MNHIWLRRPLKCHWIISNWIISICFWFIFHLAMRIKMTMNNGQGIVMAAEHYRNFPNISFPSNIHTHTHKNQKYLTHSFMANNSNVDYIETWKVMEQLVNSGKVKSIGVSNFNSEQLERLLSVANIVPAVNQVECSPQINQKKLTKFCRERNIAITGFCPLGHPNPAAQSPEFMYDARVRAIANKYGKSAAQIGLRYLVGSRIEKSLCFVAE